MALTNAYVLPHKRIKDVFEKVRDGQAPERVSNLLLKDWGFTSTNDRAFIPLLKALGFLTADGVPTQRYHNYRDHSQSKVVLGEAMKEAYGDIFLIKEHPTLSDKAAIEGKFKSFHNVSDNVAGMMAKTFFEVLGLSDLKGAPKHHEQNKKPSVTDASSNNELKSHNPPVAPIIPNSKLAGLHYNIQIHLPATKDIEVYNAIFKSLREHLLEE
ncbi:DUF5343 domain-containing protein [Rheinheimera sp.]|uniref:DUF5343 domain-containing protein n=1 Tax=Rheinheimera sp. TaxID=1869214 RepID=UPI0023529035|nr:DUF5343 domain-containing protein [Rheinheimera sp.]